MKKAAIYTAILGLVLTLIVTSSARVLAATPAECAILQQPGVYDRDSTFTSRDHFEQVKNWVKDSSFHSYQQMHDAAASL